VQVVGIGRSLAGQQRTDALPISVIDLQIDPIRHDLRFQLTKLTHGSLLSKRRTSGLASVAHEICNCPAAAASLRYNYFPVGGGRARDERIRSCSPCWSARPAARG